MEVGEHSDCISDTAADEFSGCSCRSDARFYSRKDIDPSQTKQSGSVSATDLEDQDTASYVLGASNSFWFVT